MATGATSSRQSSERPRDRSHPDRGEDERLPHRNGQRPLHEDTENDRRRHSMYGHSQVNGYRGYDVRGAYPSVAAGHESYHMSGAYHAEQYQHAQAQINDRGGIRQLHAQLAKEQYEKETLVRQLEKAEAMISKFQDEKLASVDRFQPTTDEEIGTQLKGLDKKLDIFVSKALPKKQESLLPAVEWESTAQQMMRDDTFSLAVGPAGLYKTTELRRKILRALIWQLLTKELFSKPFRCFGGEPARVVSNLFNSLFRSPGS